MAESKVIPTTTIATSNGVAGTVSIFTFYNRNFYDCVMPAAWTDNPQIKEAFIAQNNGYKNGVPFNSGDGLITAENYPTLIDLWMDNNGHLFVKGEDADNYSIDSNGHLIYTFCP